MNIVHVKKDMDEVDIFETNKNIEKQLSILTFERNIQQ